MTSNAFRAPPQIDTLPLGQRARWSIPLGVTVGQPAVTAITLAGQKRRPCLAIVAGVHGDEYDGILAACALANQLDPTVLNGSLLIIPVANPYAFAARQRRTPLDDADLNRVFPGRRDGTPSERLAHLLSERILRQADLIFTLHGAMATDLLSPWVEYLDRPNSLGETARAMAEACGIPELIALDPRPGRLLTAMAELGVPLIEGEVGGRGRTASANVAYYVERARDVAGFAGILDRPLPEPRLFSRRTWRLGSVESPTNGVWLRDVELGQSVSEGDRLGVILDALGQTIAEIKAPRRATIGGIRDHAGVAVGETLFNLWLPLEDA